MISEIDRNRLREARINVSSMSYDEMNAYLRLVGCGPCPSEKETYREFEDHLRSLPGGASANSAPSCWMPLFRTPCDIDATCDHTDNHVYTLWSTSDSVKTHLDPPACAIASTYLDPVCHRDAHDGVADDQETTNQTTQPKDNTMFDNMFNGICGRIKPGNCRLSYTGGVAIRTADGTYKTYNMKTGQLTNCDRFVFDIGDDLFMMIPTRKLEKGDIVLFGGQPKCVLEVLGNKHVKVINYNTAVIEEVVPERHVFMGRRFYGKIVSLMGNGFLKGGKGGMFKNLLKFKMMSSMLGGRTDGFGDIGGALPMMFMMGGGSFDGMFDFDDGDDKDDEDDDDNGFLGGLFGDGDEKKVPADTEKKEEA